MMRVRLATSIPATAAFVAVGLAAPAALAATSTAAVPYSDAAAAGSITLCDPQGHAVTSGSTSTAPFTWTAHSSFVPPAAYSKPGRTAFLLAYQPRENVPAGSWSGGLLSAASRYDDPAHPTVQFTDADDALDQFLGSYPPEWDGLIQLRMYYGAPDEPTYRSQYAASDVVISADGATWRSLDPGPASACGTGKATSVATILGVKPNPTHHEASNTLDQLRPAAATPVPAGIGHPGRAPGHGSSRSLTAGASAAAVAVSPAARAAVDSPAPASHRGLIVGIVVGALALGAGGYAVGRRRSPS